jgi:hypothetical protein
LDGDGALILDEDKAAVVREIFKSKAEGNSLQRIIDMLNENGVKSDKNGNWTKQEISVILKNRAYAGEYSYNGNGEDTGTVRKIPKIVSKQLFNKVN